MLSNLVLHHIGVITNSIFLTKKIYLTMGYKESEIYLDKVQNVYIKFLDKEGAFSIELIEPYDEESKVSGILKKMGVSPYHTCYATKDIKKTISLLRGEYGFIALSEPVNAIAINNSLICFLFHKNYGLLELLQR